MHTVSFQLAMTSGHPEEPAQHRAEVVPGALIADKYRLHSPLGEGGMGSVWLGQNVQLGVPVALKRILPGMRNRETLERLLIEARVGATLRHPGIVRVFDFVQSDLGDAFIVMELLEGVSLAELVAQRGQLDPVEAVKLLLPIIDALCYAHECGVVHRDLKPDNIFLDRTGSEVRPKLLDFGIAKTASEHAVHQTLQGQVMGSPAYMAPEQACGRPDVDHRADIWAICVVLYEAVSGLAAFSGDGYAALRSVLDDDVPPLAERGRGEGALWTVLQRGLQKDRDQRFQSMRELARSLIQWLADRNELGLESHQLTRTDAPPTTDVWAATATTERVYRRPRRKLAFFSSQRSFEGARPIARELGLALALIAALAVAVWSSQLSAGHAPVTAPRPQPLPPIASAAVQLAPREQEGAVVQAEAPVPRVLAPDPEEPLPQPPPEPGGSRVKRSAKRTSEAELGLKVPY